MHAALLAVQQKKPEKYFYTMFDLAAMFVNMKTIFPPDGTLKKVDHQLAAKFWIVYIKLLITVSPLSSRHVANNTRFLQQDKHSMEN